MCIQVVQLCLFILALLASPICLYLLFFYAFIRWDLPTIFVICNIRFIRKPYKYLIYATNYCCYFWTGFEQARTMSIISCPLNAQLLCKPAVAPVDDPEGTCKWSAPLCFVFAPQLSSLFLHVMSPGPEWPPSPSSGLFKPCFILTTVADALVPVLVVFLLHSFIEVFIVCCFILRILIRSVIWSSFSLGWPKIPLFFSFYNCLYEKRHSMRVSNPLLSNHASCITVGDCVVLVVFALQRHVETRVSRQTVVISREIRQWQWMKLHCLHASLNFICIAFYWSIEALCH